MTSMQPSFRKARYFGGVAIRGHLYAIGLRNRDDLRAALKGIYKDARRAARHAMAFLEQGGIPPSRPTPDEARRFIFVQASQVRTVLSSLAKAGLISPPPPSKSVLKTQAERPGGSKVQGQVSLARDHYPPARRTDGHSPGRSIPAGPDLFSTPAVVPGSRSGAIPERRLSAVSGKNTLAPPRRPSSPRILWRDLLRTLPQELRSAVSSFLDMEA